MKMNRKELLVLLQLLDITKEQEINCEEFLVLLPSYMELLRSGRPLEREHVAIAYHLEICPECSEEHEGLMDALDEGLV